MIVAILVALVVQDEHTISRSDKEPYLQAVKKFREAEGLLEREPKRAVGLLDGILGDGRVVHRDCRLKIYVEAATFRKYDLFPYQLRARARMRLAAQAADPEERVRLLESAVGDLEESFTKRSLPSSKGYLATARAELAKARAAVPKDDPEPSFRMRWRAYLDRGEFKRAISFVQSDGGFLSKAKRTEYRKKTEAASLETSAAAAERFRKNLERLGTLDALTAAILRRDFDLPDPAQLVAVHAPLEWCRRAREDLKHPEKLGPLYRRGLEAISLSRPWFSTLTSLLFATAAKRISRIVTEAQDAAAERRNALRKEAERLAEEWRSFAKEAKARDSVLAGRLTADGHRGLLARFPVACEEIPRIAKRLAESVHAALPDRALEEVERSLERLAGTFTIESRREILKLRILTRALRRLWAGENETAVARELRGLGTQYAAAGGSVEVKEYGPRIAAVFRRLR